MTKEDIKRLHETVYAPIIHKEQYESQHEYITRLQDANDKLRTEIKKVFPLLEKDLNAIADSASVYVMETSKYRCPIKLSIDEIETVLFKLTGKEIHIDEFNGVDMDWSVEFKFYGETFYAFGSARSGTLGID